MLIRQCSKVTPISELTSPQTSDCQILSTKLETVYEDIKSFQNNQEASMKSLQGSYTEHEISVVHYLCLNIIRIVDACEDSTVSTYDVNEQNTKKILCVSVMLILDEFDNGTVKELKELKDEIISIKGSVTSSINENTGLQNELLQLYESIKKIGDNKELCLIASIKCEHKIHQALTVLAKSGKSFTVQVKSEYNLGIPNDQHPCSFTGICVLPNGHVLVTDSMNYKVMLMNQHYQVISHCDVSAEPCDVCQITPSEFAVAVDDDKIHLVQFITVKENQFVKGRKFRLHHTCEGIAHHNGDLFICSNIALYQYSLSGKKVCRLYQDTSGPWTVHKCAVSPTGDKLYITNRSKHTLLTLARDGAVLAVFTDPDLRQPEGVHVTLAGQVLVCGFWFNTILQVDSEGSRKLATLATGERDGLYRPHSVCYNSTTSSMIVGQWQSNNVLVFSVE